MALLEDLRLKHIAAFIGNELGKSVYLTSITIDPEMYFSEDSNGEIIPESDCQFFTAIVKERGENMPDIRVEGQWAVCNEEMIFVQIFEEIRYKQTK